VSSETELPFDYYSMPYCKPAGGVKKSTGTINPGTILLGIRIENSPYVFNVMVRPRPAEGSAAAPAGTAVTVGGSVCGAAAMQPPAPATNTLPARTPPPPPPPSRRRRRA
jgi:hypothetical protein